VPHLVPNRHARRGPGIACTWFAAEERRNGRRASVGGEASMSSDPFGLVGTTIAGRYAVEAVVGEGGFSVVYRARHTLWDRPVAIKAFRGFETTDLESRERLLRAFVQEGAILAELSERTTAIVQARDTATLVTPGGEWVLYLVLEWLEGDTLEGVLWQERRVGLEARTLEEAVALLEPVAHALSLAHCKGICHRDLKPGNLFVLGDPRGDEHTVKLLDFGVASFFTDARRTLGGRRRAASAACGFTPAYGAPEQFCDAYGVTGPWTDVFALALLLVELVVGREPLGNVPTEELARAATDPRTRPTPAALGVDVPAAVESVLERALAIYPAERWQTAGSFWNALHAAMTTPVVELEQEVEVEVEPETVRSTPRVAPAAAILLVAALAAAGLSDHGAGKPHAPAPTVLAASR
jgi:serine/threonine protein kinase